MHLALLVFVADGGLFISKMLYPVALITFAFQLTVFTCVHMENTFYAGQLSEIVKYRARGPQDTSAVFLPPSFLPRPADSPPRLPGAGVP